MKKIDDGMNAKQRWEKKAGYITKGFKMYKKQAEEFADACEKAGRSQSSVIQELMQKFVDDVTEK